MAAGFNTDTLSGSPSLRGIFQIFTRYPGAALPISVAEVLGVARLINHSGTARGASRHPAKPRVPPSPEGAIQSSA